MSVIQKFGFRSTIFLEWIETPLQSWVFDIKATKNKVNFRLKKEARQGNPIYYCFNFTLRIFALQIKAIENIKVWNICD